MPCRYLREPTRALLSAAKHVAERQEFYDADVAIYGRFADLYAKIRRMADSGT